MKKSSKNLVSKLRPMFWKLLLLGIEIFGMYHIHLSYELAAEGMTEVCQDISSQMLIYVTAPFIAALISKTVENVFEHNDIFPKQIKEEEDVDV